MSDNVDKSKAPEWVDSNFFKEVLEYNGNLKNVIVRKLSNYALTFENLRLIIPKFIYYFMID